MPRVLAGVLVSITKHLPGTLIYIQKGYKWQQPVVYVVRGVKLYVTNGISDKMSVYFPNCFHNKRAIKYGTKIMCNPWVVLRHASKTKSTATEA